MDPLLYEVRASLAAGRSPGPALDQMLELHGAFEALDTAARDCPACGDLPDHSETLSTARNPASLPAAAYAFIPADLRSQSRCNAVVRCRVCETRWAYRCDYEFLAGGSEDEEFLDRLTPSAQIAALTAARTPDAQRAALERLEIALEGELTVASLELRRQLRATRTVPDALRDAERQARADCPVCRRLVPGRVSELARYVFPNVDVGRRACALCGTGWRVEYGADARGRPIVLEADLDAALAYPEDRETFDAWLDAVDLDRRPRNGTPALHFFVHNALWAAAEAVVADDPDIADAFGWTALHRAAVGTPDQVRFLRDHGAALDVRNLVGETPLYLAAEAGQADTVELLLAAGADPTLPCTGPTPESDALGITGVAAAGTTPLQVARAGGHDAVVALLSSG